MRTATIFYSNGEIRRTKINGTNTEIQNYYQIGSLKKIGDSDDEIHKVEALTIEN